MIDPPHSIANHIITEKFSSSDLAWTCKDDWSPSFADQNLT